MQLHEAQELIRMGYPVGKCPKEARDWGRAVGRVLAPLMPDLPTGIICRGSSGAILATCLNNALDEPLPIFYVRKPEERRHDSPSDFLSHWEMGNPLVLVDDFIYSGATLHAMHTMIMGWIETTPKPIHLHAVCLAQRNAAEAIERFKHRQSVFTTTHLINVAHP